MAKRPTGGMKHKSDRKARGRTSITDRALSRPPQHDLGPSLTHPNVPEVLRVEATRPINAGGTKHRGDRRDTSKTYTGNQKHSSRGNTPRPDVKTRKR